MEVCKYSILMVATTIGYNIQVSADELGIDVYGKTPLNYALRLLTEQINTVITYEDLPYLCKDDINQNLRAPRGGLLSYTYDVDQDPKAIIEGLLHVYHEQGYPGEFTVVKCGGIYNVYSVSVKNKDCVLVPHIPAFETKISMESEGRHADDVLREAIHKASENYVECEILPFQIPWSGSFNPPRWFYPTNIQDESLRDVLNVFIRILNGMRVNRNELYTWSSDYACAIDRPVNPKPGVKYEPWYSILMGPLPLSSSDKMKIMVCSKRPILVALEMLCARLGIKISYEDLPFGYSLTCCPDKVEVLGGIVELEWDQDSEPMEILQKLGNSEIQMRGVQNMYEVEETSRGFHIYPVKTITGWDNFDRPAFIPILSNKVTVSDDSPDDLDLLTKVCGATSTACGKSISLKTMDTQISSKLADKSKAVSSPKAR